MLLHFALLSLPAVLLTYRPQDGSEDGDLGTLEDQNNLPPPQPRLESTRNNTLEVLNSGHLMQASLLSEHAEHDTTGNATILKDGRNFDNGGPHKLDQDVRVMLARLTKSSLSQVASSRKQAPSGQATATKLPEKPVVQQMARREHHDGTHSMRPVGKPALKKLPSAEAARVSGASLMQKSSEEGHDLPPERNGNTSQAAAPDDESTENSLHQHLMQHMEDHMDTRDKDETLTPEQIWRQISSDVTSQDVDMLTKHLQNASKLLQKKSDAFDINAVFSPQQHQAADHKTAANSSIPEAAQGLTLLAHAAQDGWLPGVRELVDWNKDRKDQGDQLRLDDGGAGTTPLTLAAAKKHADVVRYLILQRASVTAPNKNGLTPLEVAAASGDGDVVDALLVNGSELANGLASLRAQLARDGDKLPRLTARIAESGQEDEQKQMDSLRAVIPLGIQPTPAERTVVGDFPADWVLLYKNRVMHAAASAPARSIQVEQLLASNTYDSFALDFSLSVVLLIAVLGTFALFMYIVFRLRLYGGPEVPVSLAHMVPGAFNPVRLADADFDPSRMKQRLSYRTSAACLSPNVPPLASTGTTFMRALFGVFCSWSFQCVRIPPEKEAFDEDFLSDDDDKSRAKVCEQCAARARSVHSLEILLRNLVLGQLIWWLCFKARRWNEASIFLFVYLQYSLVASCVSMSMVPAPAVPEKAPADANAGDDAAQLVYALFDVQYGPRWRRAICTTRSTATLAKPTTRAARRRQRRPKRDQDKADGNPEEVSSGTEQPPSTVGPASRDTDDTTPADQAPTAVSESTSMEGQAMSAAAVPVSGSLEMREPDVPFSEQWQKAFLQSGNMHIQHGAYLESAIANMIVIAITLLWLTHLRTLAQGSFIFFYTGSSAASHLFEVYGAPGTAQRCIALALELLMVALAGERLHDITNLLLVAALSLQQRYRALLFASDHQPPALQRKSSGPEEATMVKEAIRRIDECVACSEFATEISTLRWSVLRTPVALLFLTTLMLLGLAIVTFATTYFEALKAYLLRYGFVVDPLVPLSVGLCFTWPLLLALIAGALANNEVLSQRRRVESDVNDAIWAMPSGDEADDVQYVRLRLKAKEALKDSMLCWPSGRELGFCEPSLLIAVAVVAGSLAVHTGAAIPSS